MGCCQSNTYETVEYNNNYHIKPTSNNRSLFKGREIKTNKLNQDDNSSSNNNKNYLCNTKNNDEKESNNIKEKKNPIILFIENQKEENENENIIDYGNDISFAEKMKITRRQKKFQTYAFNGNGKNVINMADELKQYQQKRLLEQQNQKIQDDEFALRQRHFVRRNNRSITQLRLSKEEMKIPVSSKNLVARLTGEPTKKYKIIKKLGSGSYGTVYKAYNTINKMSIAMKIIQKVKENEIQDVEIKDEIKILAELSHPNIVKIYEFYDNIYGYYIITEYCRNGELYSHLEENFSEKQLAVLFYQVFSGIDYLHDHNILHRDLKLENIMISDIEKDNKTGEKYYWIKIIDFGTAKIFKHNKKEKLIIGSSYYIAPEVLKQEYNEKADIWSIGVILFMLLTKKAPFSGSTDNIILEKIKESDYNKNDEKLMKYSEEVRDLLSKLLQKKSSKRYSAKEALNHPWFKKFEGRALFSNFTQEEVLPYIENMFKYKFFSKLQQLVLAFLVHNFPNTKDLHVILKLFRNFNVSGNCKLTKNELTKGLYEYKNHDEVDDLVDNIFLMLDGDNNGYIEFEEFSRACLDKKQVLTTKNLEYAFKFIDKERDKYINITKICNAFLENSNEKLEQAFSGIIAAVDRDKDGKINLEEFEEIMLCME